MFGPVTKHNNKPRGHGKNNLDYEGFPLRIHPDTLNQLRNNSIRYGGIKAKASINTLINLLLKRALENNEIVEWIEAQFPASRKRTYIQFTVRD